MRLACVPPVHPPLPIQQEPEADREHRPRYREVEQRPPRLSEARHDEREDTGDDVPVGIIVGELGSLLVGLVDCAVIVYRFLPSEQDDANDENGSGDTG